MRTFAAATLFLTSSLLAQNTMQMSHDNDHRPVSLVEGLGNSSHPIQTTSAETQKYFNQGLDYIWAFNHDEARRSFQKASDLDPTAAMPLWGVALAVGPRADEGGVINRVGVFDERLGAANAADEKE